VGIPAEPPGPRQGLRRGERGDPPIIPGAADNQRYQPICTDAAGHPYHLEGLVKDFVEVSGAEGRIRRESARIPDVAENHLHVAMPDASTADVEGCTGRSDDARL
jgi:hypothetical protein